MKNIEMILHPVRFRIIQRFLDGQEKTAKQLAKEVHDIPQATLYRQLDALVKANILNITEENPIRGTVEKVYRIHFPAVSLTNEDMKGLTKEEHLQYFLFFTAQLTKNFEAYLDHSERDFEKDGVGYRQAALQLSDEEFQDFVRDLRQVFEAYSNYKPAANRTKRLVSTIMIPEKEEGMNT